jgi:hypothetical protein
LSINDVNGNPVSINHVSSDRPIKYLGLLQSPDNQREHLVKQLKKMAKEFAKVTNCTNFTPKEAWIFYKPSTNPACPTPFPCIISPSNNWTTLRLWPTELSSLSVDTTETLPRLLSLDLTISVEMPSLIYMMSKDWVNYKCFSSFGNILRKIKESFTLAWAQHSRWHFQTNS